MLLVWGEESVMQSLGFAHRPAYACANMGHPYRAVAPGLRLNPRPCDGRLYLKVAGIGMFLLWLRVAVVFYAVASISALPAVLYDRPGWKKICVPAAISAFFFHFVSLVEMLSSSHHSLPVGMHEVQSLLALLICAAFLLVAVLYRTVSFGIFALPLSLLLVLGPAIGPDHWTFHSPEIRSGWLGLHIVALLAAYAALIFSLFANFLYLVQERRLKNKSHVQFLSWLPPLETMERIASGMLLIGFPFMTLGLLAGSLIAQESVGPAYFKDPKVLLSFAMWALYLVMLFVRRQAGRHGPMTHTGRSGQSASRQWQFDRPGRASVPAARQ